jgi:cytoskeletal protein RodZ
MGLDFDQISKTTRISVKNLVAMENNDYESLPADVFTRGFYNLYARQLNLDPSTILRQYDDEKSKSGIKSDSFHSSTQYDRNYGNMAERPNVMPFSCLGLLVMLLLGFGAFLCWYFSFNPATYLSKKIRRSSETSQINTLQSPEKEFFELHNMLSIPTSSNASEIKQQITVPPVMPSDRYIVKAQFKETTKVTLAIDSKPVFDCVYKKGTHVAWSAQDKINITLPGKTTTLLSLNTTPIHLPKTDNSTLTVSIPNDIGL